MGDPSEILTEFQHLELVDNERVCKLGHGSILTCKLTHLRAPSRLMKSQLHLYSRASQKSKLNSSFYVAWQIDQGNAARESKRTEQNVLENIPAVCYLILPTAIELIAKFIVCGIFFITY